MVYYETTWHESMAFLSEPFQIAKKQARDI